MRAWMTVMMVVVVGMVMVMGCAQNTEQGLQPQAPQGASTEQPSDTSNKDNWWLIVNDYKQAGSPTQIGKRGLEGGAVNVDEPPAQHATSQPFASIDQVDELGGGTSAQAATDRYGNTQIVVFNITNQADSEQGAAQTATQTASAEQAATQDVTAKVSANVIVQLTAALQAMADALANAAAEGNITAEQAAEMQAQLERLLSVLENFSPPSPESAPTE